MPSAARLCQLLPLLSLVLPKAAAAAAAASFSSCEVHCFGKAAPSGSGFSAATVASSGVRDLLLLLLLLLLPAAWPQLRDTVSLHDLAGGVGSLLQRNHAASSNMQGNVTNRCLQHVLGWPMNLCSICTACTARLDVPGPDTAHKSYQVPAGNQATLLDLPWCTTGLTRMLSPAATDHWHACRSSSSRFEVEPSTHASQHQHAVVP